MGMEEKIEDVKIKNKKSKTQIEEKIHIQEKTVKSNLKK
jgi:hypothetical protein